MMYSLKLWIFVGFGVVAALLGHWVYTDYVADLPREVWNVTKILWGAWCSWHALRLLAH